MTGKHFEPNEGYQNAGKKTKRGNLSWCDSLHDILCQSCANLVRKSRSFSRDRQLHITRVRMTVDQHNAACAGLWLCQYSFDHFVCFGKRLHTSLT